MKNFIHQDVKNCIHATKYLQRSALNLKCDWAEYWKQLNSIDDYWTQLTQSGRFEGPPFAPFSVLGVSDSYCTVIADGHEITQLKSWDKLTKHETAILLGDTRASIYGLLGSLQAAGVVMNIFSQTTIDNLKIRKTILEAIQKTTKTTNQNEYIEAAEQALKEITALYRVSIATASRFLTLARPDMAISVNGGSDKGLAHFFDMKKSTIKNRDGYIDLLKKMYTFDWYNSPEPKEPNEKRAWHYRAALIDAFVYKCDLEAENK